MDLFIGVLVGAFLFAWTMWAVLFWASIAVIERHNPYNTFGWALVWAGFEVVASLAMGVLGFAGIGILCGWLVFLLRLLLGRYELGVLHAIGVVIVTVVGPYFITDAFFSFVGSSEWLFLFALYGAPLGVLVIWKWPRPAPQQRTNLPTARVARLWRKPPAAPAAQAPAGPAAAGPTPAGPAAAGPAQAPVAPAPVASPPAPAAPPVAAAPRAPISPPASPEPPRADGEPSFLR